MPHSPILLLQGPVNVLRHVHPPSSEVMQMSSLVDGHFGLWFLIGLVVSASVLVCFDLCFLFLGCE